MTATRNDTVSAHAVIAALPCEAQANAWGEEVCFDMPVDVKRESTAREVVDPGNVCF